MFLDVGVAIDYCKIGLGDKDKLEADAQAACQMVIDECGPIELDVVTERVWSTGSYCRLNFDATAVASLNGATDLVDIQIIPGGLSGSLPDGWIDVEYSVGYTEVPAWATQAALAYTKWLWQGHAGPKSSSGAGEWKARADALIAPHRLGARP